MMAEQTRLAAHRHAKAAFGSRTDVGCIREHNEDSLVVAPPLFAVADGMGGHAAGEVASEIAVQVLAELAPSMLDAPALGAAVEAANDAIIQAALEGRGREGMGTTMTAAMLEGERLIIAQVGDSRAYLLHQGRLQQLTRDHSLMADMIEAGQLTPEEARVHPQRSVITRALGSAPNTRPDLYEINVETGDRLLLCSDGLTTMLHDSEIEAIMGRAWDPQNCAEQLVDEAVDAGGYDNVTVVVADVTGFAEARQKKMARKTKVSIALVIVLLAALVAGAGFALNHWVSSSAYLAESNGTVAVYRGVPGSVLGLTFGEFERDTGIPVDDLNPGLAQRLRDGGVTADSLEAADALAEEYAADAERNRAAKNGATSGSDATQEADTADAAGSKSKADKPAEGGGSQGADADANSANGSAASEEASE